MDTCKHYVGSDYYSRHKDIELSLFACCKSYIFNNRKHCKYLQLKHEYDLYYIVDDFEDSELYNSIEEV